jgi:hypothetical protein
VALASVTGLLMVTALLSHPTWFTRWSFAIFPELVSQCGDHALGVSGAAV